jgi:nucleoside-diphosphate-sugar epimerase
MNVLIAGAGGFIGGHFSKHFCSKKNVNLTCVDIKKKNIGIKNFLIQKI